MIKDWTEYVKYIEFMESYEDALYELCVNDPKEWQKLKMQLSDKKYDVGSDERIYLAAMEATEFSARINDEDNIAKSPLLKRLDEISSKYVYDDEDDYED